MGVHGSGDFGFGQLEGDVRHFSLRARSFDRMFALAEVEQVIGRHDPYKGEVVRQERKYAILVNVSAHGRDDGNISQFLVSTVAILGGFLTPLP